MNVILEIEGRKAVPLRAIPFLTGWRLMSPDVLVDALARGELQAYHLENGQVIPVKRREWKEFEDLEVLKERLTKKEDSGALGHKEAYQEWRTESTALLPQGTFLWKEDLVEWHAIEFNPENISFFSDFNSEKEAILSPEEQEEIVALNFEPFIKDKATASMVLEGFNRTPIEYCTDKTPPMPPPSVAAGVNIAINLQQVLHAEIVEGRGKAERDARPEAEVADVFDASVHDEGVAADSAQSVAHEEAPPFTPSQQAQPPEPAGTVERGEKVRAAALVEQHLARWPTLEEDLRRASENGLKEAAKADKRGWWWEKAALGWARREGKLKRVPQPHPSSLVGRHINRCADDD